jgi:hypothetical protein
VESSGQCRPPNGLLRDGITRSRWIVSEQITQPALIEEPGRYLAADDVFIDTAQAANARR